jgi:hypothetical protein
MLWDPAAAHKRQHNEPARGRPLTGRARVLARRKDVLEANGVFSPLDQRRLSASGTIRQLPDGDAIPPSAAYSRLFVSIRGQPRGSFVFVR